MRQIYKSSNGDTWLLVRDDRELVAVEHRPNAASGGSISRKSLGKFLVENGSGPQGQELLQLIASLVDAAAAGPETT
jgi:hypothetical protein